jgi:chromosome segregation ATPase
MKGICKMSFFKEALLEGQVKQLEHDKEQLERQLEVKDTRISTIRSQNKTLLEHEAKSMLENNRLKDENKNLQQINDELIQRLQKVAVSKNEVETLKHAVGEKERFIQELKTYAEGLIDRIRTKNETIERLEKEQAKRDKQIESLEEKVKSTSYVRYDRDRLTERVSELYDALEEIQEIAEELI